VLQFGAGVVRVVLVLVVVVGADVVAVWHGVFKHWRRPGLPEGHPLALPPE
jgi:hypothetical protein